MSKIKFDKELKVLPIPENDKYKFELIYSIEFDTRISIGPAKYRCYVSATTGELLMRKNTVLYEAKQIIMLKASCILLILTTLHLLKI